MITTPGPPSWEPWLRVLVLALVLLGGVLAPHRRAEAAELPVYRFSVHLDTTRHTLRGVMTVELPEDDPRLGGDLWFHLPPNRFIEPDTRGLRRNTDSLPFANDLSDEERDDPLWPSGFSQGSIEIETVRDGQGRALPIDFAGNPILPHGYSPRQALMRVRWRPQPGERSLSIRFTTHFPERYWEGWSEAGILAEQWYPVLANRKDGQWDYDPFAPRPGRFEAGVTVDRVGRLFMGRAWETDVAPDHPFYMPLNHNPLRNLPLVFVTTPEVIAEHDYQVSVYSFFHPDQSHFGLFALQISTDFLAFVRKKYRLPPPESRIAIVEVDIPPGDIRTVGSIILVSRDFYSRSRLMDRILVAQLARAVAQIWFGEAVWSQRDVQSWLHLGLAGYLALDYFHSLYGWNAGIHDIVDWLQPKYREHFFEAPVRENIRQDRDAPLLISLSGFHRENVARLNAHNKAPLVIRSLFNVVGPEAFNKGLNALYFKHRFTTVTEATYARILSGITGKDLTPFFRDWFQQAPIIDFSIESWEEVETESGVRVEARLRRGGAEILPVDIRAVSREGQERFYRWEAGGETTMVTFDLEHPLELIQIDPEEYWLEPDRKNNYSSTLFRVRPLYDWQKQREVLVTLRATAGSNNIDGNYLGLGARIQLNENNRVELIPIYGQRTGLVNYRTSWQWRQFLHPSLTLGVSASKLSGTASESLGLGIRVMDTDQYRIVPSISLNFQEQKAVSFIDIDKGNAVIQQEGVDNNVAYTLLFGRKPDLYYFNSSSIKIVDSRPGYGSDFDFSTYNVRIAQKAFLGASHSILLTLIRAGSEGTPPIQQRHDLSGPLRGFPRIVELSFEEIAAGTLEWGFVLSRGSYGRALKMRKVTGFLFGDAGRGWNNGENRRERPERRDLGFGVEVWFNLLDLAEFPIRMDVAYPRNDPDFREPQFILLGVLRF